MQYEIVIVELTAFITVDITRNLPFSLQQVLEARHYILETMTMPFFNCSDKTTIKQCVRLN